MDFDSLRQPLLLVLLVPLAYYGGQGLATWYKRRLAAASGAHKKRLTMLSKKVRR